MSEFKECLKTIRKKYPNDLVWQAFRYKNVFVFTISKGKKYNPYDMAWWDECVDISTKKIVPIIFNDKFEVDDPDFPDIKIIPIDVDTKKNRKIWTLFRRY